MNIRSVNETKKTRRGGLAVIGLSWLTMTLGLFFATLSGVTIKAVNAPGWIIHLTQAVVLSGIVVPTVWVIRRRFQMNAVLLPFQRKSFLHFLGGAFLATSTACIGFVIAQANRWITITDWHFSTEFVLAVAINSCIAFLYEALPEELSLRGMVYDGLRLGIRLPAFLAYLSQIVLFVLVPVSVDLLQQLVGMEAGNPINIEYIILLLMFGTTLQLLRGLTGSLWASIGFHLAYLEIARFVVIPNGKQPLLTYTEQGKGTAEIFILFIMIILVSAIILALLNIWRWLKNK